MENISIPTTQNITLDYDLAGAGDRVIAALIDAGAQLAYVIIVFITTSLLGLSGIFPSWIWLLFSLPIFLYEVFMESYFKGQTLGKMALHIRVIQLNGTEPMIGSYILRWLLRLVEVTMCFGSIALVALLINGRGQRLGDLAAGTTVVRMRRKVSLAETLFTPISADYRPVFREASSLSEEDIRMVKEVLGADPKDDYYAAIRIDLQRKAKAVIEKKISAQSDMAPLKFLQTILMDYNYLKGRM